MMRVGQFIALVSYVISQVIDDIYQAITSGVMMSHEDWLNSVLQNLNVEGMDDLGLTLQYWGKRCS